MILDKKALSELTKIAIIAAEEAGTLISSFTTKNIEIFHKATGGASEASQVVTEVDLLSQNTILKHINKTLIPYDLALLTEESEDDGSRFQKDYFWCIDPLDGTLPFIEGKPGYCVSIALVTKEGLPVIGVIYDPVRKTTYQGTKGAGAWNNGTQWKSREPNSYLTFYHDRSFFKDHRFDQTKQKLQQFALSEGYSDFKMINAAGGALQACWVKENSPACYLKLPKKSIGGGSLWDFSASAAILNETETSVTDIYGKPLDLNRKDSTFMNHKGVLYASDSNMAKKLITLSESLINA